jgi:hypothetical protein
MSSEGQLPGFDGASDSVVRLQAAADRAAGKHIDNSRNHGKAGRRPGRPRRQGGRRGDQLRKWRTGGHGPFEVASCFSLLQASSRA